MKNRQALSMEASGAARRRLIELHEVEYAALLKEERIARGLPEKKGYVKQPTKADLKAEVERLRAELEKERAVPDVIKQNRKYMGKTS